jgi:hypothetical protein
MLSPSPSPARSKVDKLLLNLLLSAATLYPKPWSETWLANEDDDNNEDGVDAARCGADECKWGLEGEIEKGEMEGELD